jgi:hypothetical protein
MAIAKRISRFGGASNGTWYVIRSTNGKTIEKQWGIEGDVPVARDYDGDGKTDFATWRPFDGTWNSKQHRQDDLSAVGPKHRYCYQRTGGAIMPHRF